MIMEKGARNFAVISRSGADKPDAAYLVESLEEEGANVRVFRADTSKASDVVKVIAEVSAILGVVHAAMVLQDAMFGHHMTYEKFNAAIAPKVNGANALHEALIGHELDFFVMTSSIAATLENPGQTNYSAANSYLDALAYHRNIQGLAATSLVLSIILDVGVVVEDESFRGQDYPQGHVRNGREGNAPRLGDRHAPARAKARRSHVSQRADHPRR